MVENFNKIIQDKSFERVKSSSLRLIQDKNFSNEVICSHDLISVRFYHLNFVDCTFINIGFRTTVFLFCNFTNCNFTKTTFRKSDLEDCTFKNCKIFQSDLAKVNCIENNFTDCQFDDVLMAGAEFTKCEFVKPQFHNVVPSLSAVALYNSRVWNSKECIKVDSVDDVGKVMDDLGLVD